MVLPHEDRRQILMRYEAHLNRTYDRALKQLRELQASGPEVLPNEPKLFELPLPNEPKPSKRSV